MYSLKDFKLLEIMTDEEIAVEIERAKEVHEEVQEQFKQLEEDMRAECSFLAPNLNILFEKLKNIEAYIRKAENLLNDWDDTRAMKIARNNRNKFYQVKTVKRATINVVRV